MSIPWMTAAAWLAHSAVGGTLLLLLTWVLVRRTRQPVRRQRLAEWGVAAALVVAVLSWAPAWLVLDWAGAAAPTPVPAVAQAQLPALPFAPVPIPEIPEDLRALDLVPAVAEPFPEPPVAPPPIAYPPDPPTVLAAELLPLLTPWLVAAYGLLAVWFSGRWLLGHLALARLLRATEPVPEPIAQLFATLTPDKRRPRLLMSRRLRVPVSCGLWRPTVVLPAAMCDCADSRKLRWVFVHELTHLERCDAWSGLLFGLAQPLYFFVPCFWWLRRQVRLCQEYIADAAAVQPRHAADYAEFLLSLVTAPAVPRAATGVSGQSSDLYRRVSMLLQKPLRVEKRCPRRWSLTAAVSLLALAVVVAGVGWRTEAAAATAPDDIIIIIKKDATAKPEPAQVRIIKQAQDAKVLARFTTIKQFVPAENKIILRNSNDGFIYWKKADAQLDELRAALKLIEQQGDKVDAREIRRIILKALENIDGKAKQIEWQVVPVQPPKTATPATPYRLKIEATPDLPGAKIIKVAPKEKEPGQWEIELVVPKNTDFKQLQELLHKMMAQEQLAKDQAQLARKRALEAEVKARQAEADLQAAQGVVEQQKLWAEQMAAKGYLPIRASKTVLGLQVEPPTPALADQLNLPKQMGLVVIGVVKDSPAEKAGFKVSDVVMVVAGTKVPSDPKALQELLGTLKAGTSFAVVVLRKGSETALKVSRLGEAVTPYEFKIEKTPPLKLKIQPPLTNNQLMWDKKAVVLTNDKNVLTTTFRAEDRFTTRHQEGSLIITVTGKIAGSKAKVGEIHIQDGTVVSKFTNIEQVPVQYRDKVVHLVHLSTQRPTVTPMPEPSWADPKTGINYYAPKPKP